MTQWLLVALVVGATVVSDVLQSREMKRNGEIDEFSPRRWGRIMGKVLRQRYLILSILFMAISFFSFLVLLSIADLSFAVPATAASYVVETVLAKFVLKERLNSRRWAGAGLVACGIAMLSI